jgi:hypothetical protein
MFAAIGLVPVHAHHHPPAAEILLRDHQREGRLTELEPDHVLRCVICPGAGRSQNCHAAKLKTRTSSLGRGGLQSNPARNDLAPGSNGKVTGCARSVMCGASQNFLNIYLKSTVIKNGGWF